MWILASEFLVNQKHLYISHLFSISNISFICIPVNTGISPEFVVHNAVCPNVAVKVEAPVSRRPCNLNQCTSVWHEHRPLQASTLHTNHYTGTGCYLHLKQNRKQRGNTCSSQHKAEYGKPALSELCHLQLGGTSTTAPYEIFYVLHVIIQIKY